MKKSTKTKIVRATLGHIKSLTKLFDAYRQFYGQSPDVSGAREFVSERLRQDQSVIFLALQGGNGCGFTQLYPSFSSVAMRPIWILNDLFVAPEVRRLGVAKSLMQAATEFAAESEATRVVLATAIDNQSAQSLYEQTGWVGDETFLHYNYEI